MTNWNTICLENDLTPNAGLCALHQGEQVAIFYCTRQQQLFAVSNYDPLGKANVLSRGIMGSVAERTVVASPLYKQQFDLTSGECLQDDNCQIKTYPVRLHEGLVQLQNAAA